MEKVFVLCRLTLLDGSDDELSCCHPLKIFRCQSDAVKECYDLRQVALNNCDDTVDYCVIDFDVL